MRWLDWRPYARSSQRLLPFSIVARLLPAAMIQATRSHSLRIIFCCNRKISLCPQVREDLYRRKQWRRAQFLADCFWKRWLREYVPALQQRQKWVREKGNLKVNDLVLLVDENSPRGRWLLGRVMKIFPGHDQRVRVGEVKRKNSTLVRPISKLVLLEEED